jgi:hypothetical protein
MRILTLLLGWIGVSISFFSILFPFSIFVNIPKENHQEYIFHLLFFGVNFSVIGLFLLKSKMIFRSIIKYFVTVCISVVIGGVIPLIALGGDLNADKIAFLVPSFFFTAGTGLLFISSNLSKITHSPSNFPDKLSSSSQTKDPDSNKHREA